MVYDPKWDNRKSFTTNEVVMLMHHIDPDTINLAHMKVHGYNVVKIVSDIKSLISFIGSEASNENYLVSRPSIIDWFKYIEKNCPEVFRLQNKSSPITNKGHYKDVSVEIDPIDNTIVVKLDGVKSSKLTKLSDITGRSKFMANFLILLAKEPIIKKLYIQEFKRDHNKIPDVNHQVRKTNTKLREKLGFSSNKQPIQAPSKLIESNFDLSLKKEKNINDDNNYEYKDQLYNQTKTNDFEDI